MYEYLISHDCAEILANLPETSRRQHHEISFQNFNFSAPPVPCADGYVYDGGVFAHSLTSDFDAAPCGGDEGLFTKVQLPETLFWLGMMLGNTVFGWTADLGRHSMLS